MAPCLLRAKSSIFFPLPEPATSHATHHGFTQGLQHGTPLQSATQAMATRKISATDNPAVCNHLYNSHKSSIGWPQGYHKPRSTQQQTLQRAAGVPLLLLRLLLLTRNQPHRRLRRLHVPGRRHAVEPGLLPPGAASRRPLLLVLHILRPL